MARYLVTGGAGFIGSNLVEHLLGLGESVRVADNFVTSSRANLEPFLKRIEFLECDLAHPEACQKAVDGVDFVLHHAAIPSVPRSVDDPLPGHAANITATLNLLIASRDAGVKRFVYASSSSAYGDQPGGVRRESMAPAPMSPYAVQKLAGEYYIQAFSACYGLSALCLRYFNVFGPRQAPDSPYSAVIPLFIKHALAGTRPTIYGDGAQARDFTFIENNLRANVLAATAPIEARGQVYNIACGKSYSVLDVLGGINRILGTTVEPIFAPPRRGDVRDSLADIGRAQSDLGYHVAVPFEEGLHRTIEWYRQRSTSLGV